MKLPLSHALFDFITEDSKWCDERTAFCLTALNERYQESAASKAAAIVSPKEAAELLGIDRIKVVGVTGTNGKTTTASAIYSMLLDLGFKVALQGTRGFFLNDQTIEGKSLTTPTLLNTYAHILHALNEGCEFFVMEVSSHAIVQQRVEGIDFTLKLLTNITQDHLDFHQTLEEYTRVKNSFFSDESRKLINKDEPRGVFNPKGALSYGIEHHSTYKLAAYSLNDGLQGVLNYLGSAVAFESPLHGFFNLYNLVAAMAAVHMLSGVDLEAVAQTVPNFGGVSGRMEAVSESPLVIVDFAHTPDGVAQVLRALGSKELRVVLGAGGDRDRTKRPMMGRIAVSLAKKLYITSDNPRFEDPDAIIADILSGIENQEAVYVNPNRRETIAQALADQQPHEVVVILGKGDETYQIIYDQKLPFDDREVVRSILKLNDV